MKLKEFIAALNEFPADIDLSDLKTTLSIEKTIGRNSIQCAYLANHRIAGGRPWGCLQHMECQTNLNEVVNSLLTGLKLCRTK